MTHTPGPWELNAYGYQNADLDHKGTFMGLDGGRGAPDRLDDDDARTWLANARLIAAAPELLEALEMLQRQALQSSLNSAGNVWGREALEVTAAALAKAKGEAND